MTAFLACMLALTSFPQTSLNQWKQWQCQGRIIHKRYVNYAEGFSLAIPYALQGRARQDAGPERGVSIPLSDDCTSVVVVYGEANSAEWPKPVDAIKSEIDSVVKDDANAEVRRYRTRLGNLNAAGVTIRNRTANEIRDVVVAFRPGGGPVYTAILSTPERRNKKDRDNFRTVLRGFRIEKWR
jgi:hypothetical protein